MTVKRNYEEIKETIRNACQRRNRQETEVNVIAVTKYVSLKTAQEAIEAGVKHLGENRVEGFLEKFETLNGKAKFHFIGTLQSRKVKDVINEIDYLHSLDRLSLAKEIEKRAENEVNCFIQVNVSGEDSKHGIAPEDVKDFVEKIKDYSKVKVVGLMTMAPNIEDKEKIRTYFRDLKSLQMDVQALNIRNAPCLELSMGMSNDYEIAIEEGATFVRIGSALVGNETI
ncbi:YggS family pyridoxal phosphate-dependent enzyme [Lottiidibacillus patelloidae]|uniref:Pyridoxal phosphate homeostasis protein n=1 Tax=Lottiidibacillus patelloidae TaxID=2670334 RepID=A0A263BZC3_9BACI|nr:YggS family pyridoxal phosphate-dependent enzyme [Lottiidibacillus patelloidae]OZM58516.1 YggS family pyridoxal phosphate-dependent enzyme [Lottiidibacillus patelloidae]